MSRPQWRKTEFAVITGVFVFYAGLNFVMPFLPLYVQELGDFTVAETGVWSGIIFASAPLISGAAAPLWGLLADRFGRKMMLQRSLIGFTISLGLMGVAQSPWHLLAIRAFMGAFAGFSAASAALVSINKPPDHVTSGIGKTQAARVLGLGFGPIPGGILADTIGFRNACFVSMTMAAAAFIVVTVLAKEGFDRKAVAKAAKDKTRMSIRSLLGSAAFLSVFAIVFVSRMSERSFDPILPLLVAEIGVAGLGVAGTAAIISSAGLFASAATASYVGKVVSNDRITRALAFSIGLAALALFPIPAVTSWWQLLVLRTIAGVGFGAILALAFSTISLETPENRRGLVLSSLGSGTSVGSAVGYLLAGAFATISIALTFVAAAVVLLIVLAYYAYVRRGDFRPA